MTVETRRPESEGDLIVTTYGRGSSIGRGCEYRISPLDRSCHCLDVVGAEPGKVAVQHQPWPGLADRP